MFTIILIYKVVCFFGSSIKISRTIELDKLSCTGKRVIGPGLVFRLFLFCSSLDVMILGNFLTSLSIEPINEND